MSKLITFDANKIIKEIAKQKNIFYATAKNKRKANRSKYDLEKKIKIARKNLSKDRFNQYIKEIYDTE